MNAEQFIDAAQAIKIPEALDLTTDELNAIRQETVSSPFDLIQLAFQCGFMRGHSTAADAPAYGMSQDTLDALNNFSCKVEHLKHSITVFPTSETDRIIDALNTRRQPLQIFADSGETPTTVTSRDSHVEEDRNVYVHIDGSGPIEVTGGADKEAMLEVLVANLKPVLMQILQGKIYEEGDLSYDY